jgi:ferredoxin
VSARKTATGPASGVRRCFSPRRSAFAFVTVAVCAAGIVSVAASRNRFPRPEFQSDYTQPETTFPAVRPELLSYLDVAVLVVALTLAAFLALRARSRRALVGLTVASVAYFGFYRMGCICPVGAIQNIALGLFDSTFAVPLTVAIFFGLPLLFALFFGRVFCSSVCPLGALQELVIVKPVKVHPLLASILGLLPHLYLGAAVLFAVTGAGYIICRFDPFIGFFRRSASAGMILWGLSVVALGLFVARPYCRFLCPLGVVLGWASRLSKWHVTISPDECVNCRLCEDSCPVGAIRTPTTSSPAESRTRSVRRLLLHGALLPAWLLVGAFAGSQASGVLSLAHHRVRLAERVLREEKGAADSLSVESRAFRSDTTPVPALIEQAQHIRRTMNTGAMLVGMYLGGVIGVTLLGLSLQRKRTVYTPDPRTCVSCGRCFRFCPHESRRRTKDASPGSPARNSSTAVSVESSDEERNES